MKNKIIKKIENIRNKPEKDRMKIMWFMVVIFMIPVVSIWAFSFFKKNPNKESSNFTLPPLPDFDTKNISEGIDNLSKTKDEAVGLIKSEAEKAEILKVVDSYIKNNAVMDGVAMENLKMEKFEKLESSWQIEFKQYYKEIAVEGGKASFIVSDKEKTVTSSDIKLIKDINVGIEPSITQEKAAEIVRNEFEANVLEIKKGELIIYKNESDKNTEANLVWKINAVSQKPIAEYVYYVNAIDGKIISQNKLDEK